MRHQIINKHQINKSLMKYWIIVINVLGVVNSLVESLKREDNKRTSVARDYTIVGSIHLHLNVTSYKLN